jgi:hypothetical protein
LLRAGVERSQQVVVDEAVPAGDKRSADAIEESRCRRRGVPGGEGGTA